MADLEDDWAMVRAIPTRQREEDASDSLQEDWATLRNYPACLYVVNNPGPRWEDASLWRVRVLGFRRAGESRKQAEQWIVQYQESLFGPEPKGDGTGNRKFALDKQRAALSLGEAVVSLNQVRVQHGLSLQERIRTHDATIREHMAEMARLEDALLDMAALVVLRGDKVVVQQEMVLPPLADGDAFVDLFGDLLK